MTWSSVKRTLASIAKSKSYWLLLLGLAALFFIGNVLLHNWATLRSFAITQGLPSAFSLFTTLVVGFHHTITKVAYIVLILLSLLVGLVLSLFIYRSRTHQKLSGKTGLLSTLGATVGIIAPGCAACSLSILPFIGIASGSILAVLPLKGLEISLLAIGLLGLSAWKLASIEESCPVPKH